MRLDNSNYVVREYFGIPLDAEPGTVPPIDLCHDCAWELDNLLGNDFYPIDRPHYEWGDEYHCRICGVLLEEYRDGENCAYVMQIKWGGM